MDLQETATQTGTTVAVPEEPKDWVLRLRTPSRRDRDGPIPFPSLLQIHVMASSTTTTTTTTMTASTLAACLKQAINSSSTTTTTVYDDSQEIVGLFVEQSGLFCSLGLASCGETLVWRFSCERPRQRYLYVNLVVRTTRWIRKHAFEREKREMDRGSHGCMVL
jgi:hypothetical protein